MGARHRWMPCRVLAALHFGAVAAAAQVAPVELPVEVRDLARVPSMVMRETQAEVERTFLAAGVRITWADPGGALRSEVPPLRLFLVGAPPPTVLNDEEPLVATLGLAPESATWAQVFYGRVAAAVARRQVSISVILAHVIAHELGHLLLPPNSHTTIGVMRRSVDLTHPAFRRFSDDHARLMRAALLSGRRYAWACNR